MLWDEAAVLQLMQDDFPWFLQTYLSYTRRVQRSDVMRYMVLYKYGGVYLDADVSVQEAQEAQVRGMSAVPCAGVLGSAASIYHAHLTSPTVAVLPTTAVFPLWRRPYQLHHSMRTHSYWL